LRRIAPFRFETACSRFFLVCVFLFAAGCAELPPLEDSPPTIEPVVANTGDFHFTIFSDNHQYEGFADFLNAMNVKTGGPGLFLLGCGDHHPMHRTFNAIKSVFGRTVPWIFAVGNHDLNGAYSDGLYWYHDYFNKALRPYVKTGPPNGEDTNFSFDSGPIHFTVINPYYGGSGDRNRYPDIVDELYEWIKSDLDNTSKPFKLVVGHPPAFPSGIVVGRSLDLSPENRDRFWKLLEEKKVSAYICGHSHVPEVYNPNGGVIQITDGKARKPGGDRDVSFIKVDVTAGKLLFRIYRDVNMNGDFVQWAEFELTPPAGGK
jgi:hypothetical protein